MNEKEEEDRRMVRENWKEWLEKRIEEHGHLCSRNNCTKKTMTRCWHCGMLLCGKHLDEHLTDMHALVRRNADGEVEIFTRTKTGKDIVMLGGD
jgi:hypothetical protein